MLPVTIRQAVADGNELSAAEREALALVEEVANRPGVFLDMDFHESVDRAGGGVRSTR